eukprot:6212901-Pleurochrysis_carterae.AAC.2
MRSTPRHAQYPPKDAENPHKCAVTPQGAVPHKMRSTHEDAPHCSRSPGFAVAAWTKVMSTMLAASSGEMLSLLSLMVELSIVESSSLSITSSPATHDGRNAGAAACNETETDARDMCIIKRWIAMRLRHRFKCNACLTYYFFLVLCVSSCVCAFVGACTR